MVGSRIRVDGKPLHAIDPNEAVAHVRHPRARRARPASHGRRRRREEPVRLRAVRPMSMAHQTITFTFRTRQAGPLPLAVLRPLRRRLPLRLRRADADDRLHGRLHQRRLAPMAADPTAAPAQPSDATDARPALRRPLARAERDRDAAGRDLRRPAHPAGQRQACRRQGQVFDNQVMLGVRHAGLRARPASSSSTSLAASARGAARRSLDGPPIRGRLPDPDRLGGRDHDGDGALPRRLRHLRAAQGRLGRRPGPERRSFLPAGHSKRHGRAGDRTAVGVHLPLPDATAASRRHTSSCRRTR